MQFIKLTVILYHLMCNITPPITYNTRKKSVTSVFIILPGKKNENIISFNIPVAQCNAP